MRWAWGLVLSCGCQLAFPLDTVPDAPVGPCTVDHFDSGLLFWNRVGIPVEATSIQSKQLEITQAPNMDGEVGVQSVATYNLKGATVDVVVPQTVNQMPSGMVYSEFAIEIDDMNRYSISSGGEEIEFLVKINNVRGEATRTFAPVDQSQQHFWRITHNTSTDTLEFFTGPDSSNLRSQNTLAVTLPIDHMQIRLAAGQFGGGEMDPGVAIYDDFQLCLPQ